MQRGIRLQNFVEDPGDRCAHTAQLGHHDAYAGLRVCSYAAARPERRGANLLQRCRMAYNDSRTLVPAVGEQLHLDVAGPERFEDGLVLRGQGVEAKRHQAAGRGCRPGKQEIASEVRQARLVGELLTCADRLIGTRPAHKGVCLVGERNGLQRRQQPPGMRQLPRFQSGAGGSVHL